jgi:hypothetical protein
MRARTRLILDVVLLIGLVAVYKPAWTGVTLHEWLAIAAIVPLLLHFTVNWDWAVRVAKTFVERLLHASRLNFVVDCLLMVATVTAMLSGFMVTPWLLSLFRMHPANPFAWHVTHSVSADATIALLLAHTALHWRFLLVTSSKLIAGMRTAPSVRRSLRGAPAASSAGRTRAGGAGPVVRKSRIGVRAAEAARERAMALRIASVLALTTALCLAISAGVGVAGPLFRSSAQPQRVAKAGVPMVCPNTGCTASTCHAGSGLSPKAFYARTAPERTLGKRVAKTPPKPSFAAASASGSSANPRPVATRKVAATARKSATRPAASRAASKPARRAVSKRYHCPVTGCTRSSCHASYGKSASSFYK